jgi:hypothetical protein
MKKIEPLKGTQMYDVINHIRKYGKITSWQAIENYHITRLSDVIFKLKKHGIKIKTLRKKVKTKYDRFCNIAIYQEV